MRRPWTVLRGIAFAALAAAAVPAGGLVGQAAESGLPESGAAAIAPDDLRRRAGVLAHDSMRGRATPSPELEETAAYVADRFRAFGLQPALPADSYRQSYPLTRVRPGAPGQQRAQLRGPDGTRRLRPGRDFVAAPTGGNASADAPLVAWRAERGASPPGKGILLVPVTPQTIGASLRRVRDGLRSSGAAGAMIAVDASGSFFHRVGNFFDSEQLSLGEPDALTKPVVLVRMSSLPDGLAGALEGSGTEVGDWRARLHTEASVEGARASNAVGWIRGSDPRLRNQYVVFSAHMDHLGVGEPVRGDSIFNGADDDASGVAAVLELAEAFARGEPPRRSLVFIAFSGEERGLLGSRWYARRPAFELEETVAVFNMDMIGRNWTDSVAAVGKELSSLGETVDRVVERHPELGMTVVGDRWPEQNLFSRSDHYNFARHGVPALFFFSGLHEDYHQPSDEIGKLDFDKTARIVRLVYLAGRAVADAEEPPEWDPQAYDRVVEDARQQ